MKPLEEPQILYRGLRSSLTGAAVGVELTIDSFMSCSRRPLIGTMFALFDRPNMGTVIEIHAGANAYGITLSNEDTPDPEDETILNLGQN